VNWHDFAAASPELATVAKDWIADKHIMLLGTLRADGSPRISAVECDLVGDELVTGMIWQSSKALDLERDPRLTVHSLPPGKDNPDGDLKLYGRAVPAGPELKRAYEDALDRRLDWRPPEPYHAFALDITEAGMVRFANGGREITSWRTGGATRRRFVKDLY
jgi:hypothetical protein